MLLHKYIVSNVCACLEEGGGGGQGQEKKAFTKTVNEEQSKVKWVDLIGRAVNLLRPSNHPELVKEPRV